VEAKGAMDIIRLIELARLSSKEGRTVIVNSRYNGIDEDCGSSSVIAHR
jgi:hypothetical protein